MTALATPSLHLPVATRRLLHEATANAAAAASLLERLGRGAQPAQELCREITQHEREGDRIVHDVRYELAHSRSLGSDRAPLYELVDAVDDVVDAVDQAAHDLIEWQEPGAGPPTRLVSLARDLVRAAMRAVAVVDDAAERRAAVHERADELRRELRRELRGARAAVVEQARDPLSAVRAEAVLDRLRAIDAACVRVLSAAQRLAVSRA